MATTPPLTIWRPQATDGPNGEMTASTNAALATQAGANLTIQDGVTTLNIEASVFTPMPATVWTEDDSK